MNLKEMEKILVLNEETFMSIVDAHHERRKAIMRRPDKKRTAGTDDRLIQFRRLAAMRKCSLPSAAVDLCTKQITDILDMCDGTHPRTGDPEFLEELICDVQNYLDFTLTLAYERVGRIEEIVPSHLGGKDKTLEKEVAVKR